MFLNNCEIPLKKAILGVKFSNFLKKQEKRRLKRLILSLTESKFRVVLFRITKLLHIKKYVLVLDNRTVTYIQFFIYLIKDM